MPKILIIICLCLLNASCNDYPKDPNQTLKNILANKVMKVGVIQNPPWTDYLNQPIQGSEIDLISQFARLLDAKVIWVPMNESNAIYALSKGELDLVIGGLTKDTPYAHTIGITRPYFIAKYYIVSKENKKIEIKNQLVACKKNDFLIPYIKAQKAIPLSMSNPLNYNGLIATPLWEINKNHFYIQKKICEQKHVIAIRQGENQFLIKLEKFLATVPTPFEEAMAIYAD